MISGTSKTPAVKSVHLGLAWEWEYDRAFVLALEHACTRAGLSTYLVDPANLEKTTADYRTGALRFSCYLDRGSDAAKEFLPLAQLVAQGGCRVINSYTAMQWANDKATMHLEFITAGLDVPFTIILSPYSHQPEIEIKELEKLGKPFIIKPAVGGGGIGVVTDAKSLSDILQARTSQNRQKYLLQRKIAPVLLGQRRAWFRAYFVLGETFLVWWNDVTHIYAELDPADEKEYYLSPMRDIIRKIARISGLDFFSAEIALTRDDRFVVVDYVNEVCDMRLQSQHIDGVPDQLVQEIIATIVRFAQKAGTGPFT
jgi:glutathione synthase/RimK-type ligase-like ATP-grasp enzyme